MLLEYSYYDTASNDTEIQKNLTEALKYNIQTISVLPPYVRLVKSMVADTVKISCPIDYPMGLLDIKSRLSVVDFCLKNNVDIIEAVCPAQLLCNRKYEKFRDDIKQLTSLCSISNVELRYVLEYRQYSYELLYKIAQILYDFNIKTIYPSTGYSLDDIGDNIIASALINKKVPNINIICNGNLWNSNHLKMVKNNQLYGLRINSLNGLQLINS
jgi:deoxyribose-phosphate aldolase